MRRTFIFILAVCLFTGHTAATVVYKSNSPANLISQVKSDQKGVTFEFNLSQVEAQRGAITEFGDGTRLTIQDEQIITAAPGLPDVSVVQLLIRIPDRGNISLETTDIQSEILGSYKVLPVQKPRLISGEAFPFEMNNAIYSANTLYPAINAEVKSYEILGDIRIARVILYPIKVNPVSHEVRIITSMKVHLTYTGGKGIDELNSVDRSLTISFLPFYRKILNFEGAIFPKNRDRIDPGCYVFIGNQASLKAVEDFSNWKIRKGYDVKIQDISAIGNSASDLDDWIEDAYNNWPNKPEYILLCGGEDIVPTAIKNNAESDNGFGVIGNSGYIPSVHIGRITAKDGEMQSLTYQAWKIRMHEMDPYEGDNNWLLTARTWGSRSPNGITPNGRIAGMYEDKGFVSVTQDKEGQNPKTGTALVDELSKGLSVMCYIAHGSRTSWSSAKVNTSQISQIKNGRMLPWVWNIACTNSAFRGRLCFAEAWMCAGTIDEPGGTLGMYSYAPNGSTASIPMFEKGQEEYFTNKELWHMGALITWAKQHITYSNLDKWGGIIWGCPEVDLYFTDKPLVEIKADHPNVKPGQFTLKATGDGGALEGAMVGVATTKYEYLASGFTDATGNITLTVPNFQADSVFVTVTYHNHRPYLGVLKAGGVFNVITPKHGDVFDVGDDITITWETQEGPVDKVKIEFSEDEGQTFSTLEASIDNTEAYDWKAPNIASEKCLIRISDASNLSRNSGSGLFAIFNVSTLAGTVTGIVPADVHYIGTKFGSVTSDNQGAFSCEKLFPGTYSVYAQADVYFSDTVNITLPPDNTGVNLEIMYPKINVSGTTVFTQLLPSTNTEKNLKVSNPGKRDLEFQVTKGKLGDLKINELYVSVDEFYDGFEIRNQGPDINVGGWKLEWKDNQSTSGSFTFKDDFTIKSGANIVFMDEEASANGTTIIYSGSNLYWDIGSTELSIAILDSSGKGVDFVKSSGNNDSPPAGTSWNGSGVNLSDNSIHRKQDADNNNNSDWAATATATFNAINPGQTSNMLPSWLTFSVFSGQVSVSGSKELKVKFNSNGLQVGNNLSELLYIYHNAPKETSPLEVKCSLSVVDEIAIQNDQKGPFSAGPISYFIADPNPIDRNYTRQVVFRFGLDSKVKGSFEAECKVFDALGNMIYLNTKPLNIYRGNNNRFEIGPWDLINQQNRNITNGTFLAILKITGQDGLLGMTKTTIGVKK